jgi:Protein of unknown function (DUF1064)
VPHWTTADLAAAYKRQGITTPDALSLAYNSTPAKNKYNRRKISYEGIGFDSVHEMRCYQRLQGMLTTGVITGIKRQVKYVLIPASKGKQERSLVVDFVVTHTDGHEEIIEAKSKPTRTRVYLLKKRLFEERYPGVRFSEWHKEDL